MKMFIYRCSLYITLSKEKKRFFPGNSEAFASELPGKFEEAFLHY